MSYWVGVETAVGAALNDKGEVVLMAPFGVEPLFAFTIISNPQRPELRDFKQRIVEKKWQKIWPWLRVVDG